jgi:hypothetical protein
MAAAKTKAEELVAKPAAHMAEAPAKTAGQHQEKASCGDDEGGATTDAKAAPQEPAGLAHDQEHHP